MRHPHRILCVVAPALASAAAREARAEGAFVAARLGGGMLAQEGHAPPLCCGERDSWRARRASARV